MKQIFTIAGTLLVFAIIAGCTGVPPAQETRYSNENIVVGTVETLPSGSDVVIQVAQKDAIHNTIDVTFAGGAGQNQVKSIEVVYTGNDGASQTQLLKPEKGATVTIQGTNKTDNIEVYVTLYTGNRYKVVNQTSPYRTRA